MGNNPAIKVMTGSYNEKLSTNFAKTVRNNIMEQKADEDITVFSDVFPDVRIKKGDGSMNLWSIEGQYNTYLATSPTGSATGFGAKVLICDDLVKNAYEANNAMILENHFEWFTNTMLSRLESGGKIIIIMTRWNSKDLAGRALKEMPEMGFKLRHVNMKAKQDDGTMLCDDILSARDYDLRIKALGADIASANYQQEPIDLVGRLYGEFKEYTELPTVITDRMAYIDTADTGSDYLAGIFFVTDKDNNAYVLDFIYTQDGMEVTEPLTASKIDEHDIRRPIIESNNGGRGFARNVEKELYQLGNNTAKIETFHQSQNKEARILSNSTTVVNKVFMPEGWKWKHPEVYEALTSYQRSGKNMHDDIQDAITGVVEVANKPKATITKAAMPYGRRRR